VYNQQERFAVAEIIVDYTKLIPHLHLRVVFIHFL